MPSYITPEILTAIGGILGTGGLVALIRAWRDPTPKPGTPDAALVALAQNTDATLKMVAAMKAQNDHFGDNNQMFKALGPVLSEMAKDFATVRHDTAENKAHLAAIRDTLNRQSPR